MGNVVIFAGAETVCVGYLQQKLNARGKLVKVATKIPNPRPDNLIRVTAAGGTDDNLVLSRRNVIFECWAKTGPEAEDLAEYALALMKGAEYDRTVPVRDVTVVASPASYPDPDTNLPRYQFTLGVLLRGTPF